MRLASCLEINARREFRVDNLRLKSQWSGRGTEWSLCETNATLGRITSKPETTALGNVIDRRTRSTGVLEVTNAFRSMAARM